MEFKEFQKHIKSLDPKMQKYVKKDAPRVAGIEAVNHFKESFANGGFTDSYLELWKQSKRKDPSSVWYGFDYGAKTPTPDNHPKRWRTKKAYKARKANAITNFSPAATTRRTLTGNTGDLKNSIEYHQEPGKVIVESNLKYSRAQNEGGAIKVFGGKTTNLPKRQFIGHSNKLNAKIKKEFNTDIKRILKHI